MLTKYPRVLLIDDSKAFRVFCRDNIKRSIKKVHIFEAEDGVTGYKLFQQHRPDLVLLDVKMPGIDGLQLLKKIASVNSNTKIIMTTAYDYTQEGINQLIKLGAFSFVPKPMNRVTLLKVVSEVLYNRKIAGTHSQISRTMVVSHNYD